MTMPRNDIVRLRLTTLEKQDWATAAGGSRKLSEWIRSVCNDAALKDRGVKEGDGDSGHTSGDESLAVAAPILPGGATRIRGGVTVPNEKPVMVKDAIEREVRAEAGDRAMPASAERGRGNTSKSPSRPPAPSAPPAVPPPLFQRGSDCPRWMHHRKGVYCGSCKRVTT